MDSLQLVPTKISGGFRAVTPLKETRSGTPQRHSAGPRSSSAPKGKVLADKTPDELSAVGAILDAQKSSTRYISRRKERVRDNNHLIHSKAILDLLIARQEDGDGASNFLRTASEVHWKSSFGFVLKNDEARRAFLNCDVQDPVSHEPVLGVYSAMDDATESWRALDRRLRGVAERVYAKPSMAAFVEDIESTLFYFHECSAAPSARDIPIHLLHHLESPLSISAKGQLVFQLKDSSYHRLLLHAVAQYHGFHSKSETAQGRRITFVSCTRRSSRHSVPLESLWRADNEAEVLELGHIHILHDD